MNKAATMQHAITEGPSWSYPQGQVVAIHPTEADAIAYTARAMAALDHFSKDLPYEDESGMC